MRYLISFLLLYSLAFAEVYVFYVTRADQDLYKTIDGYYIKTKFCYEYVYYSKAYYDDEDNKLIFVGVGSNNSCQVDKIWK